VRLGQKGNPVILADVGVMGFLAVAVVHGGLMNIFSNLTMMGEAAQSLGWRAEAEKLRKELDRRSREFTAMMYRQVGAGS
jgi:formiminotetrahydrofolate cyclodeaminase